MEVLEVSGYITEEKAAIASRYLAPQAKEEAGLKNADVTLTEDAVAALIRYYCRESGVRKLKQQIEKVSLPFSTILDNFLIDPFVFLGVP